MTGRFSEYVLEDLMAWRAEGKRAALLTLYNVEPTGPRPAGSQMAAAVTGDFTGFISGGCIETALVEETRFAFDDGKNTSIRYGEGSPYIDIIELPCGNAIDVFIDIGIDDAVIRDLIDANRKRKPVRLITDMESGESRVMPLDGTDDRLQLIRNGQTFDRLFRPKPRLVIAGKGPLIASAAAIGRQAGMDITVVSTEEQAVAAAEVHGAEVAKTVNSVDFDAWTAVATLFHEHELEIPVLSKAIRSDAFYIGALGSRNTHAERVSALLEAGHSKDEVMRIHGPMGVPISSRNPPEIAISMIAEIIQTHHERFAL